LSDYGKRLRQASWQDFKHSWSGYVIIRTIGGGIGAALVVQVLRGFRNMLSLAEILESGGVGLGLSAIGTYLHSRRKGAESLDNGRHEQISVLAEQVKHLTPPKRTASEERKYAQAKAALEELGQQGITVLRHLENHRSLKFNGIIPPLPKGMSARDTKAILDICADPDKDLVTRTLSSRPSGGVAPILEYTYTIAAGMTTVLEELLG
jgi:hypothetical protein